MLKTNGIDVGVSVRFSTAPATDSGGGRDKASEALSRVVWHGQAAVSLRLAGKVIVIDPYHMSPGAPTADILLVTHKHDDHYSPTAILEVSKADTVKLASFDAPGFRRISPGQTVRLGAITVKAVPAYNIRKSRFHPKNEGWVGYIVEAEGMTFYHTGDTERIPEMKSIHADVMLVPLGPTYTMDSPEEAADAVRDVMPSLAIPIHFGMYEGTLSDAVQFKALLAGTVRVEILDPRV
jgi:L-ascorbate metabolism protein UlaG (beta-lactamase superfamily)